MTGEIEMRVNGSIISGETGTAYAYSIDKLQDRGRFFISPMEQVYEGQVIGEHTRQNDITVNVTKAKQLTNMRASGSDEKPRSPRPRYSRSKRPSNTSRRTNTWKSLRTPCACARSC